MKKILFLIMMAFTLFACNEKATAQTALNGSHVAYDTITDAGTTYLTTPANVCNSGKSGEYQIALLTTNISGTSTFKAILQSSIDGTNYANHFGVAGTTGIGCDTLQVTSASPGYFIFNAVPTASTAAGRRLYFRLKCVGTGTQSTRIAARILIQD